MSAMMSQADKYLVNSGRVKLHFERMIHLLVFIECLVLLQILQKWGRSDFWPDSRNIIHFDVIFPLIQEIRQWTEPLKLVKVISHAGCQLNEMADERAFQGCASDDEPVFPGPHRRRRSMDPCNSASGCKCCFYWMMRTLAIGYEEMERQ